MTLKCNKLYDRIFIASCIETGCVDGSPMVQSLQSTVMHCHGPPRQMADARCNGSLSRLPTALGHGEGGSADTPKRVFSVWSVTAITQQPAASNNNCPHWKLGTPSPQHLSPRRRSAGQPQRAVDSTEFSWPRSDRPHPSRNIRCFWRWTGHGWGYLNHNVRPADQAPCVSDWRYPLLRLGEALPIWALHAVPCLFSGKPRRLAPS